MNKIDGKQDIFVGLRNITAFKDNVNIYRANNSFIFPKSLNSYRFNKIFFHTQFIPINNDIIKTDVNTIGIDVLRISNINISDGTWGREFYLNITTKYKDPIKFLIFNNLSMLNDKFECKLIEFTESESSGSYNYEYYIIANFDFEPIADNYPFDWQHLYIAYSISDEKYGIIQPIPDKLLDVDFTEGWRFRNAVTGIKRKKFDKYVDYNLIQKVSVEETARVGWTSREQIILL